LIHFYKRVRMCDIRDAVPMADQFEGIQKLPNPIPGVPNWRCVPGYQVYGCGQPTKEGFKAALGKIVSSGYPATGPFLWINMRQEVQAFVNGQPLCARPANKIGEYAELGKVTRADIERDESVFAQMLQEQQGKAGKVTYVDVMKAEHSVEGKEILSLSAVIDDLKTEFPGLRYEHLPVCNSGSPNPSDFDMMASILQGTKFNVPVIVNCQAGLSRATTGCVIACLFREFQVGSSFSKLIDTVPGLNLELLKMDRYQMDMEKDPLFRGEFDVVKQLMPGLADGQASKDQCDKIIDLCGPAKTGGTGIKQLRENIAESKLSYEIMDDAAQAFLKEKIQDNITKYFYLIVFSSFLREANLALKDKGIPEEEIKLPRSFEDYMTEHKDYAVMIEKGKGKLKWERDIPEESLKKLEQLAKSNFKENLSQIVQDILGSAHKVFRDMADVGDHKKKAKYRFSSRTLMSILPEPYLSKIEKLIEDGVIPLDFYEVLGQIQKMD